MKKKKKKTINQLLGVEKNEKTTKENTEYFETKTSNSLESGVTITQQEPQLLATPKLQEFKKTIIETASQYKSQVNRDKEQIINQQITEKVIQEVGRILNMPFELTCYLISELYQKGSHLRTVQNRTVYINGRQLQKTDVTTAIISLKVKITHRTIAKSLRDIIYESSRARDIPGHLFPLFKSYLLAENKVLYPNQLRELSYYCTDFHKDNPNTPIHVARFLELRSRNKTKKT
ncbi:MAG: hypothetical protein ACR2HS_03375 [Gammaproteobacteria bacterium]